MFAVQHTLTILLGLHIPSPPPPYELGFALPSLSVRHLRTVDPHTSASCVLLLGTFGLCEIS